jgi:hypothetical protein
MSHLFTIKFSAYSSQNVFEVNDFLNKKRLFGWTIFSNLSSQWGRCVFPVRYELHFQMPVARNSWRKCYEIFLLQWPSPSNRTVSVRWLLAKIVAKRQRFKNSLTFYTRLLPSYSIGWNSGHKYVTSLNYLFLTKIFGFGRLPCCEVLISSLTEQVFVLSQKTALPELYWIYSPSSCIIWINLFLIVLHEVYFLSLISLRFSVVNIELLYVDDEIYRFVTMVY